MARSNSAQNTCNWIMALLALWSMVSLIVIVVWATWPPLAGVTQCREAQQALIEKMEGAKVMKEKEQAVLKSALKLSLENQTKLQEELGSLLEGQRKTNASLTESLRLQMILKKNVTALENQRFMHQSEHARLFSELAQQEALIEILWVNLTSESHHLDACAALQDAARSQQVAAESQQKACESITTYLYIIQDVYFTVRCFILFFIPFYRENCKVNV
uniref:Si:dkey-57k2.6 n=1 Tax=Sinocyclocheilus grahami TaxID=75366 RepID=A0A672KFG6_SINGR